MILTNATAKRDFYLIRYFGVKLLPAPRHTQRQDVLGVKIVTSSCLASSRSRQAVLLRICGLSQFAFKVGHSSIFLQLCPKSA